MMEQYQQAEGRDVKQPPTTSCSTLAQSCQLKLPLVAPFKCTLTPCDRVHVSVISLEAAMQNFLFS